MDPALTSSPFDGRPARRKGLAWGELVIPILDPDAEK